ncbi:MAG: trypsin-like peptidase domain-containing protein, partial [Bacteroidetes bacterium]|nr:trypsin-like peptidase domain-containing protein [Bacteroidota bacterium]
IEVESLPGSNLLSPFSQRGGVSQSLGSGVILSEDGYVVTNNHVIEGATRIRVTLNDKREYTARIVGADPTTDLAVIKIDSGEDIPVIALGDANLVEVGEWVLAVGNPFRLTSTVTAGIVSATGRQVNVIDNQLGIESFIQTDAAINPGNSGGAVVNLRGELVGIATAIATESGSYEGYGFAVPVDLMERVVRDLIRYGEVRRGYLGVSIQAMDARTAARVGLDEVRGVYLSRVQPGLAGYEGGLRDGDILLSVNGRDMTEPNELQSAIALFSPGDQVPVVVWRDGRSRTFNVTLKGRDDPGYASWLTELNQPAPNTFEPQLEEDQVVNLAEWGIGVANLDNRTRRRFQVAHGVFIAFVTAGEPFDQTGIPRGVVITSINDVPVFNIDSLNDALRFTGDLLVRVAKDDGSSAFFEVKRAVQE